MGIPEMTDSLGAYWTQPDRKDITIDEDHALMTKKELGALVEYSCSMPSGVYVGKMWKAKCRDGWLLRWYGECELKDHCSNNQRPILIA